MKALSILILLALPCLVHAWDCGDDVKNNFRMASTKQNEMTVSFSGSGADTVASEILSDMKAAGSKAGVVIGTEALPNVIDPNTGEAQHLDTYISGNIRVSVAPFQSYCPKTLVQISFKTDAASQWTVSTQQVKGKSYLKIDPSAADMPTLVALLDGSGVQPVKRQIGNLEQSYYKGKNIQCTTLSASGSQPVGTCSIFVDLSN